MAISSWAMIAVVAVAVVVCGGGVAEGQTQTDCVTKLIPCADYLNSTKPSKDCCDGMITVVTTQLTCLCGLINDPAALQGINLTQALELPKYCGLPSDTSVCKAAAAAPHSSLPPPASPGGSNGGSGAGSISWMGMPALILASALTFFY